MKRILLLFLLLVCLVSCDTTANKDSKIEENPKTVVETPTEETVIPPTIEPTPIPTPEVNLGVIKGYSSKYKSNPTSEPMINQQIHTINPLGNISTVWDYWRGDDVVVAVIDSGFDYNHPEFKDENGNLKVAEESAFIYTDSSKNVITKVGINNVGITDGDSHGTMCAGILGSSVNKYGITGIAPNCKLMLIKIDKKSSSFAEAFKYAADNGAKVISTSLGTYPNSNGESSGDVIFPAGEDISKTFSENIEYAYQKGVTIIAATGNSRTTTPSYPAACNYVIGAGGLNSGSMTQIWDNGWEGSNFNGSKVYVDVFAPSDGIYAPGFDTSTNKSTYWSDAKGTSFSAPIIAGAAALYFEKYPNKTNRDFELALKNSSVNINSYNNNKNMGWGRLDIASLLNIEEDILTEEYSPTTTVLQNVTHLHFKDQAGWDLRTIHLFNMTFAEGYGYSDFEKFLTQEYGSRTLTNLYQVEGEKRTWGYTDEGYIGDYYVTMGNTDHAKATSYDYYFPWWVTGFTYQIVNNSNWLPEGGKTISSSIGYGKTVTTTFTYSNNTPSLTQTIGSKKTINIDAVNVEIEYIGIDKSTEIIKTSMYDYLNKEFTKTVNNKKFIGLFIDRQCSILYNDSVITKDTKLYALYK